MRVLVTGGTGFIGSHTTRALRRAGHQPRLLVRSEEKLRRVFASADDAITDFVVGDVTDPDAVKRALDGCDAAIHAAATVSIERRHAAEVLDTNTRGTELVVGGAAQAGLRSIVYVSSLTAIFDPRTPGAVDASSPIATGDSAYGHSKAAAEEYVRGLRAGGAPIAIVYPSGVIGPGDPGLAESMRGIVAMVRFGIFRVTGGFLAVDVRDLATAIAALLEREAKGGYVAAGYFFAWKEFGDLLDELSGRPLKRWPIPSRVLRAIGSLSDAVKQVVPFEYPMTREAMELVTGMQEVPNSPELAELGVVFRDPHESYRDTLRELYESGHLPARCVPRIAGKT